METIDFPMKSMGFSDLLFPLNQSIERLSIYYPYILTIYWTHQPVVIDPSMADLCRFLRPGAAAHCLIHGVSHPGWRFWGREKRWSSHQKTMKIVDESGWIWMNLDESGWNCIYFEINGNTLEHFEDYHGIRLGYDIIRTFRGWPWVKHVLGKRTNGLLLLNSQ